MVKRFLLSATFILFFTVSIVVVLYYLESFLPEGLQITYAQIATGNPVCSAKNLQHWDKIVFKIVSARVAYAARLPANTELDIKVIDDPTKVADVKQTVLNFIKVPQAQKNSIEIVDVEYAIVCTQIVPAGTPGAPSASASASASATASSTTIINYPPYGNQTFPPGGNQTFPPGDNQTFPPGDNQTFPPGDNQTFPPDSGQTFPPDSGQTFPPGDNQTFPPDSGQTFPPQALIEEICGNNYDDDGNGSIDEGCPPLEEIAPPTVPSQPPVMDEGEQPPVMDEGEQPPVEDEQEN